jgi:hypothetical protein
MDPIQQVLRSFCAALLFAFPVLLVGTSARAAAIAWGPPTNISGDSDVSLNGTHLSAVNPGLYGSIGLPTTVNGVNFIAWATGGAGTQTDPSGRFTMTPAPGFGFFTTSGLGSGAAPFAALSAPYQVLLNGADYASNPSQTQFNGSITMTINHLVVGSEYEFQWWFNDSRPFSTGPLTATTGVTSVSLDPNTSDAAGGLGQYAIGTFTADATTQDILFSTTGNAVGHSGYQLRLLVPEPLPGDFNLDRTVNAADYTVWRNHLGTIFDLNGNGDESGASIGIVDRADFDLWKLHYGETGLGTGAGVFSSAVPEPAAIALALMGLLTTIVPRIVRR